MLFDADEYIIHSVGNHDRAFSTWQTRTGSSTVMSPSTTAPSRTL